MGPYKPLRNWVDFSHPLLYGNVMGVELIDPRRHIWIRSFHLGHPTAVFFPLNPWSYGRFWVFFIPMLRIPKDPQRPPASFWGPEIPPLRKIQVRSGPLPLEGPQGILRAMLKYLGFFGWKTEATQKNTLGKSPPQRCNKNVGWWYFNGCFWFP